uniref:RNase H type-1 domain-containing protein n=1 Tax=Fagus sylvatica TaxID=28930 RepID=A0A2N9IU76_FAGSY
MPRDDIMIFAKANRKEVEVVDDFLESYCQWSGQLINKGMKTLITSVAQAIPEYSFSTAAVPMTICNKLDATTRRFWWNPKKLNGSYLAWKSWEVLCLPKDASGLGFRQANMFNQALLAKLTWLIASKKKSLCLDALRSKCKVVLALFSVVEKAIDFWKDPWIAEFKPKPRDPNMLCESLRVVDLIVHGSNTWNFDLLSTLVDNESITAIAKVKPIWFRRNWSLYSERLPLVSGADFLKFVINPPISLACSLDLKLIKEQTTIHLALTLECIWNLRNQAMHNAQKINLLAVLTNLDLRIREHCQSFLTVGNQHIRETVVLSPPPPRVVKLNVDAGFTNDNASIAVVARDSFGAILQCWSKCCNTTDPCIAEALAVVWALQLASLEKLVDIQVEGDAQVCINAINGPTVDIPWKILPVISNVKVLASTFNSRSFVWVRQSANFVVHSLAKEASAFPACFHCNNSNLSPSVHEAWIRDLG